MIILENDNQEFGITYKIYTEHDVTWPEMMNHYLAFLRASGYVINTRDVADHFSEIADAEERDIINPVMKGDWNGD
jgi:hypothetical protein